MLGVDSEWLGIQNQAKIRGEIQISKLLDGIANRGMSVVMVCYQCSVTLLSRKPNMLHDVMPALSVTTRN